MHPFRRADALRRLADEEFDVLVIGGGITGAGVALDAASRGLKTALVEKGDFASGTSSKSSKMIHGGIRYLQQREFRLVYENLAERQRLLDNAPHLVSPLPFLIPLFGRDGVVSKTVARSYATALWMYDLTGGWRIGERHREVTKEEALAHLPTLNTDHLVAGFLYFDARADDARLTLTVARTAAFEFGAVVANYTPVVRLTTGADGTANGAVVRPVPDDEASEFPIRARIVVNASGVWADAVRALDEGQDPHAIRPAKGVHVTVPGVAAALRHRRRHPRPQGQALHLRRVVARDGPRLSRHHRHGLHGTARRPRLHTRGRRLPAGRRQRHHHLAPHPGRRHRRLGRPAPAPGARRPRAATSRSARPTSRAATPSAPRVTAW